MIRKKKLLIGMIYVFMIGILLCNRPISKIIEVKSNSYGAPANNAFKDENLYRCVVDAYNHMHLFDSVPQMSYGDYLTDEQLSTITFLDCTGCSFRRDENGNLIQNSNRAGENGKCFSPSELEERGLLINDASGIQKLTNLNYLFLGHDTFSSIDLSKNTKLEELILIDNKKLTNVDLSKNTLLKRLNIDNINVTNIDLSKNIVLKELSLTYNQLTNIDLSNNTNLESLSLGECRNSSVGIDNVGNNISEIDLTNNVSLKNLRICNNKLTSIDLSHNNLLETVDLYNNSIRTITLGNNSNLNTLNVAKNNLTSIDLQNLSSLESLYLFNNNLTNIDLSKNLNLKTLKIYDNQMTTIDLSKNVMLDNPMYAPQSKTIKINKFNCNNFLDGDLYLKDILEEKGYSEDLCDSYRTSEFKSTKFKKNSYVTLPNEAQSIPIDFNYNFKVQEIKTSSYYRMEDGYILTRLDTDLETIDRNITKSNVDTHYDNNKLIVDYGQSFVEEYDIVNYSSDKYDMSKNYMINDSLTSIYNDFELGFINCTNCVLNIDNENNKILIKYKNEILKEYDYINYVSDKYNLDDTYIDVKDNNIESFLSNINCTNCNAYIYDGTRKITSGDFNSGYILKISTGNDVGYGTLMKQYELRFPVSNVSLNNNSLELNLNNNKTFQLIANIMPITAENKNVTWESSNPSVATIDENGLITAIGLGEATITVKTEDGEFTDTCNVVVSEITTYTVTFKDGENTYTSEFEENEDIVFKTDLEKTGYELVGWKYNNQDYSLTDKLSMPSENIELEAIWELVIPEVENYELDNNNITGISLKTNVDNLNLGIDSIYQVKVSKHDGSDKTNGLVGTGDKVKIYLDNQLVSEYDVIIKGDVTGTGTSTVSDVAKLYQYMKGKVTMDDCYVKAGNVVDSDSTIKVNDVAKLYQFIKGKIYSL